MSARPVNAAFGADKYDRNKGDEQNKDGRQLRYALKQAGRLGLGFTRRGGEQDEQTKPQLEVELA